MKDYYVYIMTNQYNNVMYIGITNDLKRRVYEHKTGYFEGFTKKYNVHKLVYVENCHEVTDAIKREEQLKSWRREKRMHWWKRKTQTGRRLKRRRSLDFARDDTQPVVSFRVERSGIEESPSYSGFDRRLISEETLQ